jgi:hypothetical protein
MEPVVQSVPDSVFEASIAAAIQNYCDVVRRRALPLFSSRWGERRGNLALTPYGAAVLNELDEDAYYDVRDASENINRVAYAGYVTDALRGQNVVVADGKLETGFPSKSEAFRVALDRSRRWMFNPQLPIVREVAAPVVLVRGLECDGFVPGAWVQLNTVPKWNTMAQPAIPESIGKIETIESDSARVTWGGCARALGPPWARGSRTGSSEGTAVKFDFLKFIRPPSPFAVGDRVRVKHSRPAHMYELERTVKDLTVIRVDDTVYDGTVMIHSPSHSNGFIQKCLRLMNDAWHFEIDR